jgi:hypothetical protein
MTVGDISEWVERAIMLGIGLALGYFAWRMRGRKSKGW